MVYTAVTSGDKYCQTYSILPQSSRVSNWEEANSECERKRMSLAKIDNMEEDAFLRTFLDKENRELCFITKFKIFLFPDIIFKLL